VERWTKVWISWFLLRLTIQKCWFLEIYNDIYNDIYIYTSNQNLGLCNINGRSWNNDKWYTLIAGLSMIWFIFPTGKAATTGESIGNVCLFVWLVNIGMSIVYTSGLKHQHFTRSLYGYGDPLLFSCFPDECVMDLWTSLCRCRMI
jgi:hypothetical protein